MDGLKLNDFTQDKEPDKISPRYLLSLIKPVLADELVAKLRYDREGLRIAFCNGQKFRVIITEI